MITPQTAFSVSLSDLDRERHGVITAKAYVTSDEEVTKALAYCREHHAKLLIIRCPTSAYTAARAFSTAGMMLLDTLVYYRRDLTKSPADLPTRHTIRQLQTADHSVICEIAKISFAQYPGHYQLDPRLDRTSSDAIYLDWARRSCTDKSMADNVLVAEVENTPAGFLTLKKHGTTLELVLSGVAESQQGRGVYRDLIAAAIMLAQKENFREVYTSTQAPNLAVQKTWIRCGLEPHFSTYTFHHWL